MVRLTGGKLNVMILKRCFMSKTNNPPLPQEVDHLHDQKGWAFLSFVFLSLFSFLDIVLISICLILIFEFFIQDNIVVIVPDV